MTMTINIPNRHQKSILKQLLEAGLIAANPAVGIHRHCSRKGDTLLVAGRSYRLRRYNRVVCVGTGKASEHMILALQQILGERLEEGIIVVKDPAQHAFTNIDVYQAGHPTPDRRSLQAAKIVQQYISRLTSQDLLMVLISGGTSSLLAAPAEGLTLKDKQRTTQLLLRSGATIQELNVVRKHLSTIKGGQLAASTPATIVGLILSDVIDDDIATIGSGPTAPDSTTFQQAHQILKQYGLWKTVPLAVRDHIKKGIQRTACHNPKPQDPRLRRVQNVVVGNNQLAIQHIARTAKQLGFRPSIQTSTLEGEAKEVGANIASLAKELAHRGGARIRRPACLIWGGEPTVTMTTMPRTLLGGRAQECALAAAIGLAGLSNVIMAGLGTDGSDGPTDVAGAVVTGHTIRHAIAKGINPHKALLTHDSYAFFQEVGGHIKTGPTGTNVNDIYLLLAL